MEVPTSTRVLVVGTGGIGCELLKNLVLAGFKYIECVDLDTIDVSNLNRQFLFRRAHVGLAKATIAAQAVSAYASDVTLVPHTGSIFDPEFSPAFFRSFDMVLNALDNVAARRHVNRLCLATGVPLIESGTAGYLGQVAVIRKDVTECYECSPAPAPKSYPVCTIRTTPSAPIHCIVWAKYLIAKLYGSGDDDAPPQPADDDDPERSAMLAAIAKANKSGDEMRSLSFPDLFDYLFDQQIKYLLSMTVLWETRDPPTPITHATASSSAPSSSSSSSSSSAPGLASQQVWSVSEAAAQLESAVAAIAAEYAQTGCVEFDKDVESTMAFVTAAANLRARCFGIDPSSLFDAKAMAGSIIPAIATTNAIAAGLMVVEAMKIVHKSYDQCRASYILQYPTGGRRTRYINISSPPPPNPDCFVCGSKYVTLAINTTTTPLSFFIDSVLRSHFSINEPSVEVDSAVIFEMGEDAEDMSHMLPKMLADVRITDSAAVSVSDFSQDAEFSFVIVHDPSKDCNADLVESRFAILRSDDAKRGLSSDDEAGDDDCLAVLDPPTKKSKQS